MREIRSYGSVGVRGGNEPHYPEVESKELRAKGSGQRAQGKRLRAQGAGRRVQGAE